MWRIAYWIIGPARIALAFVVCHLIGRAYADAALGWFVKFGVTPEALDQFNKGFAKAEWVVIPFFAGSNLVADAQRDPSHVRGAASHCSS